MSALAALRTATRIQRSAWAAPISASRTVAFSRPQSRILLASRRCYSTAEEKPAEATGATSSTSSDAAKDEEAPLSEEQKVFAAKDAEILDLTVRAFYSASPVASNPNLLYLNPISQPILIFALQYDRVDYATPKPTSRTSNE